MKTGEFRLVTAFGLVLGSGSEVVDAEEKDPDFFRFFCDFLRFFVDFFLRDKDPDTSTNESFCSSKDKVVCHLRMSSSAEVSGLEWSSFSPALTFLTSAFGAIDEITDDVAITFAMDLALLFKITTD